MKNVKKTKKPAAKKPGIMPLADRVLIKEIETAPGGETQFGLIIPETVSDDKGAKKGKVIAVGEGRTENGKRIPMSVSVGDTVLFQWGDMVKINGEEYYIVGEGSIMAVINYYLEKKYGKDNQI